MPFQTTRGKRRSVLASLIKLVLRHDPGDPGVASARLHHRAKTSAAPLPIFNRLENQVTVSKRSCLYWMLLSFLSANLAVAETANKHHPQTNIPQPPQAAPAAPAASTAPVAQPSAKPFDFQELEQKAKALAATAYSRDEGGDMPEFLKTLNYDQYRDIRFKPEQVLWRDEKLPYQVEFFHRGSSFRDRVNINIVDQGKATPVDYSPEQFDFGRNALPEQLPKNLGFAGIRLRHPLRHDDVYDEIGVFLGASYFRAVGLGQHYGISARGLAVDTGLAKAEEFPIFKEFWLEKPAKNAKSLSVFALMDSPSVTGAYRFIIQPGLDLTIQVKASIFVRKPIERLGLAPLTSMFFHGENTDRFIDDLRPEVHDSDGLLMERSNGEWVWRPLDNPKQLRISVFHDERPKGFGLMKRDRQYDHYQDMELNYQGRPSAWVEPMGDWGPGAAYLIEIPSDAEKYDNIVAFWVPDFAKNLKPVEAALKEKDKAKLKAKTETKDTSFASFEYKLHFLLNEPVGADMGRVESTRIGAGGVPEAELDSSSRKFAVDFNGEALKRYSAKAPMEAEVSISSGKLTSPPVVHKNEETGSWRLSFILTPEKDNKDPIELRGLLKSNGEVLTETWLYQWSGK